MNQDEFKNSFKSSTSSNKSERIIKEEPLPGILNHPVPQTLHGDRDYDYLEQKEPQKTIISSSVTQEDIEFYNLLEEKKEKSWKRRLKQDEEFKRELEKIKSREELLYNLEDNLENPRDKEFKTPRSYFQEDNNKYKPEVKSKNYKESKLQQRLAVENARKQREMKGLILDTKKTLMMSLRDNSGINWGRSKLILKHLEMHHRHPNVDDKKMRDKISEIIKIIK